MGGRLVAGSVGGPAHRSPGTCNVADTALAGRGEDAAGVGEVRGGRRGRRRAGVRIGTRCGRRCRFSRWCSNVCTIGSCSRVWVGRSWRPRSPRWTRAGCPPRTPWTTPWPRRRWPAGPPRRRPPDWPGCTPPIRPAGSATREWTTGWTPTGWRPRRCAPPMAARRPRPAPGSASPTRWTPCPGWPTRWPAGCSGWTRCGCWSGRANRWPPTEPPAGPRWTRCWTPTGPTWTPAGPG
jgi:hypothetical protein